MTAPIELTGLTRTGCFKIHAVGITDVGKDRDVNEDTLFLDEAMELFLVCDGMGGHTNGQLASEMAVESIVAVVKSGNAESLDREQLIIAVESANSNIYQHAARHPDCRGMGTTAIGVRIDDDRLHICHVGDSRLYRLRSGNLEQLTRDHSLANLYSDKPELDGRLGPATSNVIVRAVGLEPQVNVDHREIAIEEDDLFLLCCDGLNDLVDDQRIAAILNQQRPHNEIAAQLVNEANNNGGTDNITVIVLSILDRNDLFDGGDKTTLGF